MQTSHPLIPVFSLTEMADKSQMPPIKISWKFGSLFAPSVG